MVDFNALVPWRNNKTKTAKRDDYVVPFVTFRREMDRMFERFFDGFPVHIGNGWRNLTPAVDIDETEKEMVLTAELPEALKPRSIPINTGTFVPLGRKPIGAIERKADDQLAA